MNEKAIIEELSKYPTLEEIEKEYKEWAVNLLKVRFDLKPEAFDPHHAVNYSFENCADCLWNNIKGSIEQCLWLQEKRIRLESQVTELEEQRDRQAYIAEDLIQEKHRWTEQARRETAREFADKLKAKCEWNRKQYCCEATVSSQDIDELAKQYGVEVDNG